jgi:hypothetical protein
MSIYRFVLLIPVILCAGSSFEVTRVVDVFSWWISKMGVKVHELDVGLSRYRSQVDKVDSLMMVVFSCSDLDTTGIIPSKEIVGIVREWIPIMLDINKPEVPPMLLALNNPMYSKQEVCAALTDKRDYYVRKVDNTISTSANIQKTINFYNTEITNLRRSIWGAGVFPTGHDTSELYSQLVHELEQLRTILNRDYNIRNLVDQNLSQFNRIIKIEGARMSGRVASDHITALLNEFIQTGNLYVFTDGVLEVYSRSVFTLSGLSFTMARLANSLKALEKGATATRVLNLENILIRGVVYTPAGNSVPVTK